MKIYGLFEYMYDYHEWEELIVVSRNKERLEKFYENYRGRYGRFILVEQSKHAEYADAEHGHMVIREVQVV